ncbi:hypothetical protein ILYODFUR_013273 [Ilyodon furcidens]|uniref:Uncharacterized protein n=1 Tax=Ilyodon furcidens TaxID=33524 RepID=A0ABV0T7N4_9TELE
MVSTRQLIGFHFKSSGLKGQFNFPFPIILLCVSCTPRASHQCPLSLQLLRKVPIVFSGIGPHNSIGKMFSTLPYIQFCTVAHSLSPHKPGCNRFFGDDETFCNMNATANTNNACIGMPLTQNQIKCNLNIAAMTQ